nr:unnamed protein product [Callosobruchus chinensis]
MADELEYPKPTYTIVELPEEIKEEEVLTRWGAKKKRVVKKRVIKKQAGDKQEKTEIVTVEEEETKDGKEENTEIVTVEEEGKKPQTTVTVYEADEIEYPKPTYSIIELPEEIKEEETVTRWGAKKKKITKKRVIKKQQGDKQEKTEIVTVEEEGKQPEVTVTVQEILKPEEIEYQMPIYAVVELPEEVQVEEITTPEGRKKKKIIRKGSSENVKTVERNRLKSDKKEKPEKKQKDKRVKEREEIEILEEEEEEVVRKKQLIARKPKTGEYEIDEENVEEIKPFELTIQKGMPVLTSSATSEAICTGEVTQVDQTSEKMQATLGILPHAALIAEHTQTHDVESSQDEIQFTTATATPTVDKLDAVQISEQQVHDVPGRFDETFKPTTSSAAKVFESRESVTVQEITLGDTPSDFYEQQTIENKAIVSVLPQEAKSISETQVSLREEEFISPHFTSTKPLSINMGGSYSEAVSTTQVTHMQDSSEEGKADVGIIPHTAVSEFQTQAEEKESITDAIKPTAAAADKTLIR